MPIDEPYCGLLNDIADIVSAPGTSRPDGRALGSENSDPHCENPPAASLEVCPIDSAEPSSSLSPASPCSPLPVPYYPAAPEGAGEPRAEGGGA